MFDDTRRGDDSFSQHRLYKMNNKNHTKQWVIAKKLPRGVTGWWLGHPSEKYKFVNWDD